MARCRARRLGAVTSESVYTEENFWSGETRVERAGLAVRGLVWPWQAPIGRSTPSAPLVVSGVEPHSRPPIV